MSCDKKIILILGGNGFIGAECVEYLLDNNQDYDLILVNRDNWDDWDTKDRIKSRIKKNIICDRKKDSLKVLLSDYLDKNEFKFEAVIDFSAYKSRVIKNFFNDIPANKFKIYILISTDSVYEVCSIKPDSDEKEFHLYESDSVRPESKSEREKLKELDSYGHHKLKCEEELIKQAEKTNFPYIILRLPDVIGPRDSTNRFWFYQMYFQYLDFTYPNQEHEICISKFLLNKKTSYVYVKDVAKIINQVLKVDIKNEIFNLGYEENLTIIEFLSLICSLIRPGLEKKLKFVPVSNRVDYIYEPFPSVTKGPVGIEKAKELLNFKPLSLIETLKETVEFYNQSYKKFPNMRKIIEKDLKKELIKNSDERDKFFKFIENYSN